MDAGNHGNQIKPHCRGSRRRQEKTGEGRRDSPRRPIQGEFSNCMSGTLTPMFLMWNMFQASCSIMRYGDLNPVRAGLVKSPKDWQFSSYRHYAFGEKNPLIDDASDYVALGSNFIQNQNFFAQKLVFPLLLSIAILLLDHLLVMAIGCWIDLRVLVKFHGLMGKISQKCL